MTLEANAGLGHCGKLLETCQFCPVFDLCEEVFNQEAVTTVEQPTTQELLEEFLFLYEDRYCQALSKIYDLEEQLAEAGDTVRRLVEGNTTEWNI